MRVAALLCCSVFLIGLNNGYGQQPVINWQRIYGGPYGEYAHSIRPTSDGGYIVAGYTEGDGGNVAGYHGNLFVDDIWVIKLNSTGDMEWQRVLGGTYLESGADVRQTSDGGYLVAGTSASIECEIAGLKGFVDFWVVKLSPKGDMLWQKHYGGSNQEFCYGIDLTGDGGFMLAGYTESVDGDVTGNHGKRDYWVMKADANGNLVWQKALGGSGDDLAMTIKATPDGGCVVSGSSESNDGDVTGNHGWLDMWVVKLDATGNLEWQKSLGGLQREEAWAINLSPDGGYIAAGYTESNDGDVTGKHPQGANRDYWVVKLSSTGALQWNKCYGGGFNDMAFDVQPTPDGGYIVGGSAESNDGDLTCNAGQTDMWIIKINSTGNLVWQKNLGGSIYDEVYAVQALADGTVVAAGMSCSPNVYGQTPQTNYFSTCADFWVVKLTVPVAVEPPPVVTISPSPGMVCAGKPTVFTASFQYAGTNPTFQWTKNGTPVGTNSHIYTGTGLAANDVIACKVTSGGACYTGSQQSTASVSVKINNASAAPQLKVTPGTTVICNCDMISFSAGVTGGGSAPAFLWKVNGVYTGVNSDTFFTASLKPGDRVTCAYADATICIPNDTIYNTIDITGGAGQMPSVSIAASANPVCAATAVIFTATPLNAGANPTYQWKVNGVNAGTNSPTFTSSSLSNGDVVACTILKDPALTCVTTPAASSNTITMNIAQAGNPSVTIAATASTICRGTSVTFTATTVNAGNPIYEWKFNGAHVGGNTQTLTTNAIANGDVVSCDIVVDPNTTCISTGRASSNNITMTVTTQVPPTATVMVTGNDVCAGNSVNFTVAAQNAGATPAYRWMVNGVPVNNTTTSFNSATLSDGDKVYCMITPGQGTCSSGPVSSDTIVAIIHPLPHISISPADTVIKPGAQVQLRTAASNVALFEWSPGNKLLDPAVLSPRTIQLTENTTYVLSAESDRGCRASASAVIRVGRALAMPNAFTPNNDGFNDVFRIPPAVILDLKAFAIFDRWGNKVFTTNDISRGWDGTFKGQQLNAGVYVYMITGNTEQGKVIVKGTVNLVR